MRRREELPCVGAWVRDLSIQGESIGEVTGLRMTGDVTLQVLWRQHPHKRGQATESPTSLACGFRIGMHLEHVPSQLGRRSLGMGELIRTRKLGGREQVLVDFWETGQRLWLPYQHFRMARGVEQRFRQGIFGPEHDAERFRLRCLAHALELWNENTGSLSRFDIDPLPHQIHLVHRILGSGHLNWMIADDVGLGKTIEVGMLLAALRQRGQCRRILLVTPPGLTVQWQEELSQKFQIDDFLIFGRDFEIHDPRHWKLHDHVIASIDRLKQEERLEQILEAQPWDLVVFDEAHRLSRRQYGLKYDHSQRYALAARLRPHAEHMLLLTATPHQGMSDKFHALLELIRPDLKDEIQLLELNPEILRDMIIRNRKDHVTDAEGNLIFKGKQTHALAVPVSAEAKAFDVELQRYLRHGALAGAQASGTQRRAIGFVMNIYRKLAASSAAAIHQALRRRRDRLMREHKTSDQGIAFEALAERDARYEGEHEEAVADGAATEFFAGEIALLDEMLEKAERLLEHDAKLKAFTDQMVDLIHAKDADQKILIFTEYRATQSYLQKTLQKQFGGASVELIHGGQAHDERRAAIARFESEAKFLISTEAGGEGINLHRRCHILVNYDLPWNPMRLVQRIGRLYRYGQHKPVLVFNVHAPETLDGSIVDLLYQRLEQVVRDMASVSNEFRAGLEDEILGQMVEMIDVESILENAAAVGVQRTQEEIEEALRRAREAAEMQNDLFQYVGGYNRDEASGELRMGADHLKAFVYGMFQQVGIRVLRPAQDSTPGEIEIPESMLVELSGWRARERITFDRRAGAARRDVRLMDLDSPLVSLLLARAKDYRFGGLCSRVRGLRGAAVAATILRWQSSQGLRMRQEFAALQLAEDGANERNSEEFSQWLLTGAQPGSREHDREEAKRLLDVATRETDKRFAEVSNVDLHPENRQWLAAGWID